MNATFAVALLMAMPASASPALAQQKNCLNCHQVERKVVGPAFKDVAQRYAGQKDVAPRLAEKIRLGGAGAWGPVPMAANPQVTPDEAKKIANELRNWVAKEIGPIAKPKDIRFGDNLPKTRSGKIMRRLLRSIARGEAITQDTSTLENPAILEQLAQSL